MPAKKKKKVRKGNFMSRLHRTAKVKSIRKKIRENKSKAKKLSAEYRRTIKSESKKLK